MIWYLHGEILSRVPSPAGWVGSLCEIGWNREIHIVVIYLDRLMLQPTSIIDILSLVSFYDDCPGLTWCYCLRIDCQLVVICSLLAAAVASGEDCCPDSTDESSPIHVSLSVVPAEMFCGVRSVWAGIRRLAGSEGAFSENVLR